MDSSSRWCSWQAADLGGLRLRRQQRCFPRPVRRNQPCRDAWQQDSLCSREPSRGSNLCTRGAESKIGSCNRELGLLARASSLGVAPQLADDGMGCFKLCPVEETVCMRGYAESTGALHGPLPDFSEGDTSPDQSRHNVTLPSNAPLSAECLRRLTPRATPPSSSVYIYRGAPVSVQEPMVALRGHVLINLLNGVFVVSREGSHNTKKARSRPSHGFCGNFSTSVQR